MGLVDTPWTAANTLDQIAPSFPSALVTREAHTALLALARRFPASYTNWMYLECRLAWARTERADFILRLTRLPSSVPRELIEEMWLEFDVATNADLATTAATPGFFLHLAHGARAAGSPFERVENAQRALRVLHDVSGVDFSSAAALALARCVRALRAGASLLYLGCFPHRSNLVRLCVLGLADAAIAEYLERVDWPGDVTEVNALITPFSRASTRPGRAVAIVHLDIGESGESIAPTVGFELGFARASQSAGRIEEQAVLDTLVRESLCTSAEREALATWPMSRISTMRHELWPSVVTRRLNHVKLTHAPGRPTFAKAYLALSHRQHVPRSPDRLNVRAFTGVPPCTANRTLLSVK